MTKDQQLNIQQEKLADKAYFQDLYKIRKINNLVHKLTYLIQKNRETIKDNYQQLELELIYLNKELANLSKIEK